MSLRELHLFAGVGGGILGGMLLGHRCVGAVEIDPYCRRVLEARQRDGILEPFPIHDDIRTFDGTAWRGRVDIVCGGFPCQDVSDAGQRRGIDAPRSGLWFEMARVVREIRPRFVFVENVGGLLVRGLDRVLGELASLGFDAEWCVRSASDCGAPHQRKRIWILATHADRKQHEGGASTQRWAGSAKLPTDAARSGLEGGEGGDGVHAETGRNWGGEPVRGGGRGDAMADAEGSRLAHRSRCETRQEVLAGPGESRWWAAEPHVGRLAHGVPARVDRLRSLGNAQVPQVAAAAFRELMARMTQP